MKMKIFLISFASGLCALALILGVVLGTGLNSKVDEPIVQENGTVDDFLVNTPNSGNGIKLISEVMALDYPPDDELLKSYTITASVNAGNLADDSVTWTMAYADGSAVSLYTADISVSGKVATVNFYDYFAQQIIVTATSVQDTSLSASCTIDCYKRVISVGFETHAFIGGQDISDCVFVAGNVISVGNLVYTDLYDGNFSLDFDGVVSCGTGSISPSTDFDIYISLSSSAKSALTSAGIAYSSDRVSGDESFSPLDLMYSFITGDDTAGLYAVSNIRDWFTVEFVGTSLTPDGEVINTVSKTYTLTGFDISDAFKIYLSLDNTSFVF